MTIKYLIIISLSYALSSPINILIHELAHAISALIFTKGTVTINLGTKDNPSEFHFGRIKILFNYRHLFFKMGLTYREYSGSLIANQLITLSGPLSNIAVSSAILYFYCSTESLNDYFFLFLVGAFLNSTVIALLALLPQSYIKKGTILHSDGLRLIRYFGDEAYLSLKLISLYKKKKYKKAIRLLAKLSSDSIEKFDLEYVSVLICLNHIGEHLLPKYTDLLLKREDSALKFQVLLLSSLHTRNEFESKKYLDLLDVTDSDRDFISVNSAFFDLEFGRYEKSKEQFLSIKNEKYQAYICANMAFIEYKLNRLSESEDYLSKALSINKKEPYIYRSKALIEMEKGNMDKAKLEFEKALSLELSIQPIKELDRNFA